MISIGKCPDFSQETVVLDVGSGCIKSGFAMDAVPSVVIPTLTGKPKNINDVDINPYAKLVGKQAKLRAEDLLLSVRSLLFQFYVLSNSILPQGLIFGPIFMMEPSILSHCYAQS